MKKIANNYTLVVILLINLSGWTAFSILGPLALEIAKGLSVGVSIMGVIHSICLVFSGIISFLWASLEHKYSRKFLLTGSFFLFSFGLLLSSISINYILFLLFRMIMAFGFGAILPLSNSIIMDLKSSEHRTKSLALLGICIIIGFGISNLIAGIFLTITSWRMILFILGFSSMVVMGIIFAIDIPPKGITEKALKNILNEGKSQYSFHFEWAEFSQLPKIRSNIHFLFFFFIHDFVIGTMSFYMIPMLKSDLDLTPIRAMILNIIMYFPQLFGAPYWGKVADRRFIKKPNGKISTMILIVIIGPLFSIIGYSIFSINILIFVICIMIFAFITPSLPSMAYSILGDINPPELRSTMFSFSNFCSICGRSIGIGVCGILYDQYFKRYGIIFLLLQFVFLIGVFLTIIKPLHLVPTEMQDLTFLLKQRVYSISKDINRDLKPNIKDILNTMIENQIELFKKYQQLAQNQIYLTKFLNYSLEVMKRLLLIPNKKELEIVDHKYLTPLGQKLDYFFKRIEELKAG